MNVKIRLLNPNSVLPSKAHDDDFCYDCVATSCEEIAPNIYKYGLGIAFEIDRGSENGYSADWLPELSNVDLAIDVRPRSSIYKTGMVLSNSLGTIDFPYRGEVSAVFYHLYPNLPKYEVGDRVAQIKLGAAIPMDFEVVSDLSTTERGASGYGSTGR